MTEDQKAFLEDEFFSLTLMATVQRAGGYAAERSDRERREFQRALRSRLETIAKTYKAPVLEERHIQNIEGLADTLSLEHAEVLANRRFRIGPAQKALNLYLKYLWCVGEIPMPPHCPCDFQIIRHLRTVRKIRWTDIDDIAVYRTLVQEASMVANGMPLALWELRTYNRA